MASETASKARQATQTVVAPVVDGVSKMRAWAIMLIAVVLFVLARWSKNEPAVTLPIVASGAFAIAVIALLDHGGPATIARGLAWLFVVGAAYQAIPAITGAIQSINKAATNSGGGGAAT